MYLNKQIKKQYLIKIPNNISMFYCDKKKIITFLGPLIKKSLKLQVKLFISTEKKIIKISYLPYEPVSNHNKKKIKSLQGTTCALIKQMLIETTSTIYKKLKFVGVGYRLAFVDSFKNQLILLRLGFSHLFYFRIPKIFIIFCKKRTQLFISGNSYQSVAQLTANIRILKKPEPYKGKGILYSNEKISLKKGKKV